MTQKCDHVHNNSVIGTLKRALLVLRFTCASPSMQGHSINKQRIRRSWWGIVPLKRDDLVTNLSDLVNSPAQTWVLGALTMGYT